MGTKGRKIYEVNFWIQFWRFSNKNKNKIPIVYYNIFMIRIKKFQFLIKVISSLVFSFFQYDLPLYKRNSKVNMKKCFKFSFVYFLPIFQHID